MPSLSHAAVWAVGGATVTAMLTRPRGLPEWCWALAGAAVLLIAGLVPAGDAVRAVADGWNVYLFLAGIIVLAELSRAEGVFDWLASMVVPMARGSTLGLFTGIYAVGIVVTALLSNDATVLLLTPAVVAVVRRAGAPMLPFAFACAFVANAASFILPISNPANLLVFRDLPTVGAWLNVFGLSSVIAVGCTFVMLCALFHRALRSTCDLNPAPFDLRSTRKITAITVAASASLLVVCTELRWPVGPAASVLGLISLAIVARSDSSSVRTVLRESPWSIIPLVGGLFVIVAALNRVGAVPPVHGFFALTAAMPDPVGKFAAGAAVTAAGNLFNNLPVGVLARFALHFPDVPARIAHAALVAIDLGPNLSVTGSLATLLWLIGLRREGVDLTPLRFLQIGAVVTIPALVLGLAVVR